MKHLVSNGVAAAVGLGALVVVDVLKLPLTEHKYNYVIVAYGLVSYLAGRTVGVMYG